MAVAVEGRKGLAGETNTGYMDLAGETDISYMDLAGETPTCPLSHKSLQVEVTSM
ncbi:hypothetical protein Hanom_Chr00s000003g01603421 [Helianthus anomalus]